MHNGVDKLEVFCRVSPEDGTPSPGWCCSFSPCGGYIAIGQANGRIAIWDNLTRGVARNVNISLASQTTSSSNEKQHVQEHSDAVRSGRKRPRLAPDYLETPVTCVAWSCDSKTLLCGSASMAWVLASIDTDSGAVLRFFDFGRQADDPYPATVAYHPTCPTDAIIALSDGSVLRLNTLSGKEQYYCVTDERRARLTCKDPEALPPWVGSSSSSSSSRSNANPLHSPPPTTAAATPAATTAATPVVHRSERAMVVSPDGLLVFVGGNTTIDVYHASTFQLLLSHNTLTENGGLKKKGGGSANEIMALTIDATGQLLVANLSSRCLRVFGIIVEEHCSGNNVPTTKEAPTTSSASSSSTSSSTSSSSTPSSTPSTSSTSNTENKNTNSTTTTSITLIWTGVDLYDAINRSRRIGAPLIVSNQSTGSCIVAGEIDHHKLFVWEASSGKLLRAVSNHWPTVQKHLGVVSLASHPTRVFFASCAMDGTVCLWCPPTKQDWSCKMLDYVNLDQNVVVEAEEEQDEEKDEEKVDKEEKDVVVDKGEECGVDLGGGDGGGKKRKRTKCQKKEMTQEEKEQKTVVNVLTKSSTKTFAAGGESFFFLRSDPPDQLGTR